MTFLKDAPAPREFWARRQAHETTIHMVDAQSALLGRVPSTDEAGISSAFAADGLDELLRGFFTRGKSKLFDGKPFVTVVAPDDVDRRWVLRVDERLSVDAATTTWTTQTLVSRDRPLRCTSRCGIAATRSMCEGDPMCSIVGTRRNASRGAEPTV